MERKSEKREKLINEKRKGRKNRASRVSPSFVLTLSWNIEIISETRQERERRRVYR